MTDNLKRVSLGMMLVVAAGLSAGGCAATVAEAPTSIIDGTWSRACQDVTGNFGTSNGQKESIVFSGGVMTFTETYYAETTCVTADVTMVKTSTFTVGSANATEATSTDLDLVSSTEVATPITAAGATTLNTIQSGGSACTGVTWVAGTAVDLIGKTCMGDTTPLAAGVAYKSLFVLTTTATPNTLQLADTHSTTRPTTITGSSTYEKQ